MIIQIDVDDAWEPASRHDNGEPARVQIGLRRATFPSGYLRHGESCPRRWLLNLAGWVYYTDDPDDSWDD